MRTDQLIQAVRDQALEFDHDPVTDDGILTRINFAYAYAYNHFVKSNDSLFAKRYFFDLVSGLSEYDLPRDLWGKRVETLEVPTPPQKGYEPFNYVGIERVDPQSFPKYDAPRARTLLPIVWTQMRNKLHVAPPPLVASRVRILGTPAITPLGLVEGLIQDFQGDMLTLDRAPTKKLTENLNAIGQNLISICDGMTGEIKVVYPYTEINGMQLRLGDATNKTVLRTQPIIKLRTYDGYALSFNAATHEITLVTQSPIQDVALGDFIEVTLKAVNGQGYNIEENLTSDADFYNPPEYVAPVASFTRGGKVMAVGTNSITWLDPDAVPSFVNGYPNLPGVALAGTLSALAVSVYLGHNVVKATCAAPHGLEVGQLYKVTLTGTGTTADGTQKVIVKSATEFWVLLPTLTGTFVPGSAWSLYQYADVATGWPELREVALSTPIAPTIQVAVKSPYTFSLLPARSNNNPEAYDPANNVLLDDIVVWGLGTGIPIIPEAYHECLAQYAILTLKSSLNETDNEVAALLKEMFTSMKGDTAGRRLGCRMERTFSLRSNYLTQSRRMGRR